jgi:uncharacterized protein YqgV (UPF0045/DUF77 family)
MLIELSITPLGRGTHLSKDLADILKIIDDSHVRSLSGVTTKRVPFPTMSSQLYGSRTKTELMTS